MIHESINHSNKEYVRGDIHTNTIEGVLGDYEAVNLRHPSFCDGQAPPAVYK